MKENENRLQRFLFSVITVNYNNKCGLERTITSVMEQSFKHFEFIVVDGNSDDGSQDVLSTLVGSNVKISSENDDGIYDAMNKGLRNAIGEYVVFMNSGDCFSDIHVLDLISSTITENSKRLKFIYGDSYEKEPKTTARHYKKAKNHSFAWYGMFAHHQSMFFAREVLVNNRIKYDEQYELSADWSFVLKVLKKINHDEIKYLNVPISIFELGGFSSNYVKGIKEQFKIRHEELGWNRYKCMLLSGLHYVLNMLRNKVPLVYSLYLKVRSKM